MMAQRGPRLRALPGGGANSRSGPPVGTYPGLQGSSKQRAPTILEPTPPQGYRGGGEGLVERVLVLEKLVATLMGAAAEPWLVHMNPHPQPTGGEHNAAEGVAPRARKVDTLPHTTEGEQNTTEVDAPRARKVVTLPVEA